MMVLESYLDPFGRCGRS